MMIWNVDSVITIQQKFCDPHEGDIPQLRRFLNKGGISSCFLEFDVTLTAGPFAIRTEAFLERLESEVDLF